MKHRNLGLLLTLFILTRLFLLWGSISAGEGYARGEPVAADVDNVFSVYARQIVNEGRTPYSDIAIEYPPGALPFMLAPEIAGPRDGSYRTGLALLMFVVDVAALVALIAISRRWGSWLGPAAWIVLVGLLGPMTYLRLDLVPAVATILAVERISASKWWGGGGWLGFGILAKLYPAVLLPAAFFGASDPKDRRRLLWGAAVMIVIPLLALSGVLADIYEHVISYQGERGVHIESTLGSVFYAAIGLGFPISYESSYFTFHLAGGISSFLELITKLLMLLAAGSGAWLAFRTRRSDDERLTVAVMFTSLTLFLGFGNVFSPQYVIWVIALGASCLCAAASPIRTPVLLLAPAAALTQWFYPFQYVEMLNRQPLGLSILLLRNLLVVGAGLLAFLILWRIEPGRGEARRRGEAVERTSFWQDAPS